MRIACLAWGSLVWKSRPLVLASAWRDDGPLLPIEFARVGDGGELATALCPTAADMRTSWALLDTPDLATAREWLRQREQIAVERPEGVGSVTIAGATGPIEARIVDWAHAHGLDAAIWTALPPRSKGLEGRMPSLDEAVDYLAGLQGETREHAEQYVRRVPVAIATAYRAAFEHRLGWTPEPVAVASLD